jgi:arginase
MGDTAADPDMVIERVGIVLQPYTARRGAEEWSTAPELLLPHVTRALGEAGLTVDEVEQVGLSADEEGRYGAWQRLALADHHLGVAVSSLTKRGTFVVGLLGNCNSALGMLAGLQNSGASGRPLDVGLIWIDAHADFNTPETTLSGWLGGMPVSVAAGQSLVRLRMTAGLGVPISTRNIVMMGQRGVDPLEQALLDDSQMTQVSAEALLSRSQEAKTAVAELSRRVDVIYLHVDLDILDASEIPGSFFETPGGPTAARLAGPLRMLMLDPKVRALGIASFPTAQRGREKSMASAMTLLRAAADGLKARSSP